jgi:hypothetical protein
LATIVNRHPATASPAVDSKRACAPPKNYLKGQVSPVATGLISCGWMIHRCESSA